ncbi:glycoside hydrolase family 3 N-terminal domain-containing protein [Litoreibacter albidus]|uniref:beta-N-acetylhexosaminidase n=1 Tax=Litoreibacter albidus TaxID=670155 RepID=A0A1H2YE05_9RHOB|nr:glycoside hydrolase family 3 N-terminal domain-containing protein [Litoreibacter albidus]SDX03251.1 beta-N-acetylhexosaminidase [Litoreibacter albidus]
MPSGAYIFGCEGLRLSEAERRFFASANPWGFILFARNIENRSQLSALTTELRDSVGWDAPVLIDQEGGRVQRMRAPEWREYPPALDQMAMAGENAARAMYLRNRLIAAELFEVGIDVNCAPLADVIWPESHPVLRNRCYGSDVDTVVQMCLATEQGLLDGGVLPVLKHIPGYGRAVVDGHKDLPTVDVPRAELDALDFAPFKRLTHMAMGMTAHIVFPCIDDLPATTSPKAMAMIREDIGFDNLIMTDDISMEALSGAVPERARASLDAGCDIALHCNGDMTEMAGVAEVCGAMTPAMDIRAKRALSQRKTPTDVDISALEAEFRTLVAG